MLFLPLCGVAGPACSAGALARNMGQRCRTRCGLTSRVMEWAVAREGDPAGRAHPG